MLFWNAIIIQKIVALGHAIVDADMGNSEIIILSSYHVISAFATEGGSLRFARCLLLLRFPF